LEYLKGRAMLGLEAVTDHHAYVRSVRMAGKTGWIKITHLAEKRQLALQVAPGLSGVLMPLLSKFVRNLIWRQILR